MSDRAWVSSVFRALCSETGLAQRLQDVRDACARVDPTRAALLGSRTVSAMLDAHTRAGYIVVVGYVAGLRSGGRRLYWPADYAPPSRSPEPRSATEAIRAIILPRATGLPSEPFCTADIVQDARRRFPHLESQLSWPAVYAAIRNLSRQRQPLVAALHVGRNRTRWTLIAPAVDSWQGSGARPRNPADPGLEARLWDRVVQLRERTGCVAVLFRDVLSTQSARDRGLARLALHRLGRETRDRRRNTIRDPAFEDSPEAGHALVRIGRFDGSAVLSTYADQTTAQRALPALYALQWLRRMRRRLRGTPEDGRTKTVGGFLTAHRLDGALREAAGLIALARTTAQPPWSAQLDAAAALVDALTVDGARRINAWGGELDTLALLEAAHWRWEDRAGAARVLLAFPEAPRTRQAVQAFLLRCRVFYHWAAPTDRRNSGTWRTDDGMRWDAIDLILHATRGFGSPTARRDATHALRYVGLGRPDPDAAAWPLRFDTADAALGFRAYQRAVDMAFQDGARIRGWR